MGGGGVKRPVRRRGVDSNWSYTSVLIGVNVGFFLLAIALGFDFYSKCSASICGLIALQPALILMGQHLWTFITSMFMHGGLTHLFVNMISLMFIGNFVEKLIGKRRFVWLYFGGGIFAGVLFVTLIQFLPKVKALGKSVSN